MSFLLYHEVKPAGGGGLGRSRLLGSTLQTTAAIVVFVCLCGWVGGFVWVVSRRQTLPCTGRAVSAESVVDWLDSGWFLPGLFFLSRVRARLSLPILRWSTFVRRALLLSSPTPSVLSLLGVLFRRSPPSKSI